MERTKHALCFHWWPGTDLLEYKVLHICLMFGFSKCIWRNHGSWFCLDVPWFWWDTPWHSSMFCVVINLIWYTLYLQIMLFRLLCLQSWQSLLVLIYWFSGLVFGFVVLVWFGCVFYWLCGFGRMNPGKAIFIGFCGFGRMSLQSWQSLLVLIYWISGLVFGFVVLAFLLVVLWLW